MAKVIRENSDSNMVEMALEYLKGLEFPKIPSSSTLHKLIAKLKAGKRTERQGINPFYVSNFIKKKTIAFKSKRFFTCRMVQEEGMILSKR